MKSNSTTKSNWFCETISLVNGHSSPGLYRSTNSSPLFCCNRVKTHSQIEEDFTKSNKDVSADETPTLNLDQVKPTEHTNIDKTLTNMTKYLSNSSNTSALVSPAHQASHKAIHQSTLFNPSLSVPNLLIYNPSVTSRLK